MFVTVGLLVLTILYIGMVVTLEYLSPVECLDDLCQSEGVDNTILNWASNFFLAFWCFIFALHLSFSESPESKEKPGMLTQMFQEETRRAVRKMGIVAQIFMGGAFISIGVGSLLYPNSGVDDNKGMLAYWTLWIIYAVFFTLSAVGMSHFAFRVSGDQNFLVPVCASALFLAMVGFLTGTVWCSTNLDLQVDNIFDDAEETNDLYVCFDIVNYSVVSMNFIYALLWIPVGIALKEAAQEEPVSVLGLSTPVAGIISIVMQCTLGSMLLVILFLIDLFRPDISFFDVWNTIYGTVLYHWAMLITMYCLHNLTYGLPYTYIIEEEPGIFSGCFGKNDEYDTDDDRDEPATLSWEWWVTMVAGQIPEPKKKRRTLRSSNRAKENDNNSIEQASGEMTPKSSNTARSAVTWEVIEEEEVVEI